MKFLVVGGAGYIGSHMVKHLRCAGHDVIVADNCACGPRPNWVRLDIADAHALDALFAQHRFSAVFHFASFIQWASRWSNPPSTTRTMSSRP